ncbi:hypothetical protein [Nocardia carnea]|uniref:hypothetical protein n=1 Tax=Nocardia carnea TaxID=37328 RepID=UPI00031BED8E|nr:hypothetical protein [Nocardia carnea]
MSTDIEQAERRAIARQLHHATSGASEVTTALDMWCGNGDYATASEQTRDAAGLRALAELEATVENLTAVLEHLASTVAGPGTPSRPTGEVQQTH